MSELLKTIEKNITKQELKEQIVREAKLPYKTVYAEKIGESKEAIDKLVADSLKSVKDDLNKVEGLFSSKFADIENVINPKIVDMTHEELLNMYADMLPEGEEFDTSKFGPLKDKTSYIKSHINKNSIKTILKQKKDSVANKLLFELNTPNELLKNILTLKVGEIKKIIQDVKSLDVGAIETKKKVIKAIDDLQSNISTKMQALRTDVQGDVLQAKEFIHNVKEWIGELFKPQNLIFIIATLGTLTATITAVASNRKPDKIDVPKVPKL